MVNENKHIQSVERAMSVLEEISNAGGSAKLAELSEKLQLHKSTIHGLLNTLAAMGYVARHGTSYALGLRLRELSQPLFDVDTQLKTMFAPALEALFEYSQETCYLAVPCGTRQYLCIDAREGTNSIRLANPSGSRKSLVTSAIGKIFLAYDLDLTRSLRRVARISPALDKELKNIVEQGYALDLEEAEAGLHCLAMPLRWQGRVVAALGVAGPSARLTEVLMRHLSQKMMKDKFDIIKL